MKKLSIPLALIIAAIFFGIGFGTANYFLQCDYSALDDCMSQVRTLIDERENIEKQNLQLDNDLRKMYLELERLNSEYNLEILIGDSLERNANLEEIVSKMDSIINVTNNKLDSLQNDSKNPSIAFLKRNLSELKQQIREKELEIERLRNDNDIYQQVVDMQTEELLDIRNSRDSLIYEIEDLNEVRDKLSDLIDQAKQSLNDTIGQVYYSYALDLIQEFDNTKNGFLGGNKKLKKSLLENAFKCFLLSCQHYNESAQTWLVKLMNNPDYNKFLELNTTSNFDISDPCSIKLN